METRVPSKEREEWSIDEFLNWEEQQPERWELIEGQPWRMMAGGTIGNAVIAGNIWRALDRQLRGSACKAFSDQVKVRTAKRIFYPDVFVRCGPIDPSATVVDDPVVVVEVVSPSTKNVDWGEKLHEYRITPSIRHYLIVSGFERRITHWRREGEHWVDELAEAAGVVLRLDAVAATLTFDETFEGFDDR
jgi:Uma2 family endonuclease